MRYSPSELERLSMAFDAPMKQLEEEIMADIVRRIRINSEITRSADWQINRLYELGMSKQDIENRIQSLAGISPQEVQSLYSQILEKGYAEDEKIYRLKGKPYIPFEENEQLQQLISATAAQTSEGMQNITQSLGFAIKNAEGKTEFLPIAKYYQSTLDKAMLGITLGAFDYNTILKKTVAQLVNSGLRTVDYASGHSNRVEVATRRAVMTGFNQIVAKVNEENADKLETEYFEVSWHGGARPTHQVWQGRVYSKKDLETVCGLGDVQGLCGANCYHSYHPFDPEIDVRTYTDEQLDEMNRQENTPVEFGGKQYTKYEALQRQRRLETTMRAERQKIKLLQEGGASEDDIITARAKYRVTSAEYTRFSKAMNLPQQRERVTVDGLGNIGVGKYKVTNNIHKPNVKNSTVGSVANSSNNGIINANRFMDNLTDYKPVTEKSIADIPKLKVFTESNSVTYRQANLLNDRYQNASKNLLREVKKYPIGTEVSIVYDENMKPIKGCGYVVGKIGSVKIDNPNVPYHAFHNHASGQTFSVEDLINMTNRPQQLSLSATGNNSSVYSIIKTQKANDTAYNNFLTKSINDKSIFGGFSYLDLRNGKVDISIFSEKQIENLKSKIIQFSSNCAKEGEKYGYRYICK